MALDPSTLDLGSLALFATAVRTGSVSQAAAAHFISQPSASARIHKLETQLGVQLLERSARGSVPTSAGGLVAAWTADLLGSAERLISGVEALREQRAGTLRIAASYTVAEYLLPKWLAVLKQRFPDTAVELQVTNSAGVIVAVTNELAELGFTETPDTPAGLEWKVVGCDELVLVVHPDHPWAHRRTPMRPAMFERDPLIIREPGSGTRESFERALRSVGVTPCPPLLELGSTAAVKGAVLSGAGAAVLSLVAVEAELREHRLHRVEVIGLDLSRQLRATWVAGQQQLDRVRALLHLIEG
jgi:DNA-binding transcriptional LysR family regulator